MQPNTNQCNWHQQKSVDKVIYALPRSLIRRNNVMFDLRCTCMLVKNVSTSTHNLKAEFIASNFGEFYFRSHSSCTTDTGIRPLVQQFKN